MHVYVHTYVHVIFSHVDCASLPSDFSALTSVFKKSILKAIPVGFIGFVVLLQCVSIACYAERCISYSKSVRLSVRLSDRLSVTRWH